MTYFRELPNVQYQSFLSDKKSSQDYIIVKNIFRRAKIRDDLQNVFTLFNKYQIVDGTRPELIAEEIYGSVEYDWIVIISAGITNIRNQWPLSNTDLYNYCERIYGSDLNSIHHYETIEVKDNNGRLILPKGQIVDSNFTITNPIAPIQTINPVIGITNYEYETLKNNEKSLIYLLKPEYLQTTLRDMRRELFYDESSQYIDQKTIKTENTYNTLP
jgi:hypothetical protein